MEPEAAEEKINAAEARLAELADPAKSAEPGSYAESVEVSRTLSLLKSIEDFGSQEELDRRFGPGTLGEHEARDRLYVAADSLDTYCLSSPAIQRNQKAFNLVVEAYQFLNDAYQELANDSDRDGQSSGGSARGSAGETD